MTLFVPFDQLTNKLPIRRKDFQSADTLKKLNQGLANRKGSFHLSHLILILALLSSLVPGSPLIPTLGTRLLLMSSGISYLMSCLFVHLTGKKLLFPDPMVLKAVLSLQENLARI